MIDDYEEDYEAQELRQQAAHDRKRLVVLSPWLALVALWWLA